MSAPKSSDDCATPSDPYRTVRLHSNVRCSDGQDRPNTPGRPPIPDGWRPYQWEEYVRSSAAGEIAAQRARIRALERSYRDASGRPDLSGELRKANERIDYLERERRNLHALLDGYEPMPLWILKAAAYLSKLRRRIPARMTWM